MKKSLKLMAVVLSVFLLSFIGYALAHPTSIVSYSGSTHTGCHGANNPGSGTLSVTTSVSGRVITLTVSITGFTEAVTPPYHGTVSIGLPYGYGDNNLFGQGISMNNVQGENNYWATSIWEENLTSTGDTMHDYTFKVLAPEAAGTYELKIVALTGMNITENEVPLYNLEQTITITVKGNAVTIASLSSTFNFGNFLTYILFGSIALGPLVLILLRKRK
ncbi:MAG: hypothetical protein ACFFB0_07515 [Promethearchaeota archaeon]